MTLVARKCNRCGVMKTTKDFEAGRRVCYKCRNGTKNAIARRSKWQRKRAACYTEEV